MKSTDRALTTYGGSGDSGGRPGDLVGSVLRWPGFPFVFYVIDGRGYLGFRISKRYKIDRWSSIFSVLKVDLIN